MAQRHADVVARGLPQLPRLPTPAPNTRTPAARSEPPQAKGRSGGKTASTQQVASGPGGKKDKLAAGSAPAGSKGKYSAAQPMTAVLKPSDKAAPAKGTTRTTNAPAAKSPAPSKPSGKATRT